jgi:translocator protein
VDGATKDGLGKRPAWPGLLAWVAIVFVAAAIGSVASYDSASFYRGLDKPAWAPPASLFGPVWTVLYLGIAVAAWLVWKAQGFGGARSALGLFIVQLALNALWTWLFFAWRQGALAFVDIVLLWVLVAGTLAMFWRVRKAAGMLLVPYLAWVTFAAALNYSVWQRNTGMLG